MAGFDPVPLPSCGPTVPADSLRESIRRWVNAPPLRQLVAEFGGRLPELDIGEQLAWLDRFSAAHWDFRNRGESSVERDAVIADSSLSSRAAVIEAAAAALGLAVPLPPPRRRYTHLLVLGGLARACLVRTAFAAQLLRSGAVATGEVAALGSFRPLGTQPAVAGQVPEQQLLDELGFPGCRYEVDAMDAGVRAAFGFTAPDQQDRSAGEVTNRSWSVLSYRAPGRPPVHVLAAPSSQPAVRRATTPDSYHFWAQRVALSPQDRVLVVTTPIYVPFQHCDAIRALGLPYGCGVDTVGFDPALVTEALLAQTFGPDRYLQEVRSAIRSMRDLLGALAQPAPR